jgi:4-amino-4-deoxy-L-arabinose transferase-like glycosyltransferase
MQSPPAPAPSVSERASLRGRTEPWSRGELYVLALLVVVALWLRVYGLSAEGFGDDEVHKWLAANRYLRGDFSGDDVEHPMLMKSLISLALLTGRPLGWAPETITRLPNVVAGGVSVVVVASLGRRLFGRAAGLWAGALAAVSVTLIGYQRVAKEDTLLGLFLMLLCWCIAEAKAAADDGARQSSAPPSGAPGLDRAADGRRWELCAAGALAGMLASKYFFFLTPIPVVFYLWVRGTGTAWRVPVRRWMQLIGVAMLLWVCLDWTPFLPSTWEYAKSYVSGGQTVHGSLFFMGRIYHNLVEYGLYGTPPWFYLVFTAVKLAPVTLLFALAGLGLSIVERRPAHRLLLSWLGVWFLVHSVFGSKWGRFFTSVLPAFLLLAGYAAALLAERARRASPRIPGSAFAVGLSALLLGGEAQAAVAHAPHERLYISPLGGGDRNVTWFFPHCDYFDAGYREAIHYVAAHAEPYSEVSSEIDWPSRLYAERAGRHDLMHTIMRRGYACRLERVCYVIVQTGRLYFFNQEAVASLASRVPWHVERIRGEEVVKVYRLEPGEAPFPDEQP